MHADLSKACQNLPNYLPKPCPNPSQTPPECLQNPIFYRNHCHVVKYWKKVEKSDPKPTQNPIETDPKWGPNPWNFEVEKNISFANVFSKIFLDFRFQNPWFFGPIFDAFFSRTLKMRNIQNLAPACTGAQFLRFRASKKQKKITETWYKTRVRKNIRKNGRKIDFGSHSGFQNPSKIEEKSMKNDL